MSGKKARLTLLDVFSLSSLYFSYPGNALPKIAKFCFLRAFSLAFLISFDSIMFIWLGLLRFL